MTAERLTDASRALDANADIYPGAKWYFYLTGTSTAENVYADADLSTSLGAVVTADAGGKFVPIYFDSTKQYRGVLKNADGSVTIHDIDPINIGLLSQLSQNGGWSLIGTTGGMTLEEYFEYALPVFRPEDYGAVGDGTTNCYTAFKLLRDAVQTAGAGVVEFKRGATYKIDSYRISGGPSANGITNIYWDDIDGLVLNLNGAKIDIKGDFDRSADYSTVYSYRDQVAPFMLRGCEKVVIRNGEIDGNVDQMTRGAGVVEGDNHGIGIYACKDVVIENMYIHHMAADGVYLSSNQFSGNTLASEIVTVRNCRLVNNARINLTIAGARGVVSIGNDLSNTGKTNTAGTAAGTYGNHAPVACIDIEPADGVTINYKSTLVSIGDRYAGSIGPVFGASYYDDTSTVLITGAYMEADAGTDGQLLYNCESFSLTNSTLTNITIAPAGGLGAGETPGVGTICNNVFIYTDPARYVMNDNNATVSSTNRFTGNQFFLRPATAYSSGFYPFRCENNPNHSFIDNYVYVASTAKNADGFQMIGRFPGAGKVCGNYWITNRTVGDGKVFYNDYTGTRHVANEEFKNEYNGGGTLTLATRKGPLFAHTAAGSTLGTVTRKMEIFDESGASKGFVPIYDAIT